MLKVCLTLSNKQTITTINMESNDLTKKYLKKFYFLTHLYQCIGRAIAQPLMLLQRWH